MQYIKRVLILVLLIAFAFATNKMRPEVNTSFSILSMSYFIVNILFIITMLVGFMSIKSVTRTKAITTFECIGLFVILIIAFFPQIDEFFGFRMSEMFGFKLKNMSFIYYIQFIFGYWLFTFFMMLKNAKANRNGSRSAIRYMG